MMRFLVRKATSVGIAPTLRGFTRHYSLRPSSPPNGKLAAFMKNDANATMCLGVSATVIANTWYWIDFGGFWERRAADNKKWREVYAQNIERSKLHRINLENYVRQKKDPNSRRIKWLLYKAKEETSG